MDINYLLYLQDIRNSLPDAIPRFFLVLTKFSTSIWPIVFLAMLYWVADRREGRKLLGAFSLSLLFNGLLKTTFCVYRPWIRDARVEPYGDVKVTATGYSFPSGHSMYVTPTIGGLGLWLWNRNRRLAVFCFAIVALVLFSRNFLGCHTFQDVAVGCIVGFFCVWLSGWLEAWSESDPKRDKILAIAALLVCIAAYFYYMNKSYPLDYNEDGTLLCDPAKLIADCFEGLGCVSAFYFLRIFEKKGFSFDELMPWKDRFIVGVFSIIPLYFWRYYVSGWIIDTSEYLGRLLGYSMELFFIMIIVPWIMKKVYEYGILSRERLQ